MVSQLKLNKENIASVLNEVADAGTTVVFEGAPGIGKTEITQTVIENEKRPHLFTSAYVVYEDDTRPSVSPNISTGEQSMNFSSLIKRILYLEIKSFIYHQENPENKQNLGIFYLDEMNLISPSDMKAIFHYFNARELDVPEGIDLHSVFAQLNKKYSLKNAKEEKYRDEIESKMEESNLENGQIGIKDISLMTAWNDPDRGFLEANYVDPSMKSRLAIYPSVVDIDNFVQHAINNYDADVASFVLTNKQLIAGQDASNMEEETGKVSPRMLSKLSDTIKRAKRPNGSYWKAIRNDTSGRAQLTLHLDSLLKNHDLSSIFISSIANKNRLSIEQISNMEPSKVQKEIENQNASEQARLMLDVMNSSRFSIGSKPKKGQVSINAQFKAMMEAIPDEIKSSVATSFFHYKAEKELSGKPNYEALISASDKSTENFFEEFNRLNGEDARIDMGITELNM